jgi:hypothetical protein
MLVQDVQDGYLPAPRKEPRGPRSGIGRIWESWTVRRALYLYRLRRRGAKGQLLKVLLFLKDGWGWDDVQPICLAGLRKIIDLESGIVRQHIRKPTASDLEFSAEDMASEHSLNPESAAFRWGMGFVGEPLEGGSLMPVYDAFHTFLTGDKSQPSGEYKYLVSIAELLVAGSGLTWGQMHEVVQEACSEQANRARQQIPTFLRMMRQALHAEHRRQNLRFQSSNLLTWCGRSGQELTKGFRSLPGRITPAQLLAAMMSVALITDHILQPLLGLLADIIRLSLELGDSM